MWKNLKTRLFLLAVLLFGLAYFLFGQQEKPLVDRNDAWNDLVHYMNSRSPDSIDGDLEVIVAFLKDHQHEKIPSEISLKTYSALDRLEQKLDRMKSDIKFIRKELSKLPEEARR